MTVTSKYDGDLCKDCGLSCVPCACETQAQNAPDLWIYSASLRNFIDQLVTLPDGRQVTSYSHRTIENVREEYADAQVMEFDAALAMQEAAFSSPPVRSTKKEFQDMLGVLPPMQWAGSPSESSESFKMCEFLCGRVTGIYARRGSEYFSMHAVYTIKHREIMDAIDKAFPHLENPKSIHVHGRRWIAKRTGTTYCTAEIYINGVFHAKTEKEYGYGEYYQQAAFERLHKDGIITWKPGQGRTVWAREHGIDLTVAVDDVTREKDL